MIHYITTNGVGNAWVANELRIVKNAQIPFMLHAIRKPHQFFFASQDIDKINRETEILYPLSTLATALSLLSAPYLFRGRFFRALWNGITGPRESAKIRIKALWHLVVACHWARTLRNKPVSHIHSQWIHSCGTVGMYGAMLLDKPFSFTGHAADLFRDRAALLDKIRHAEFIVCISTFHRDFYLKHGARPEQLKIVYCGIDTSHFSPPPNGPNQKSPCRILTSGRLVEKKGFKYLIEACRILADRGVPFECVIAGSGELESDLKQRVDESNLKDKVTVTGEPLLQEKIPEFMHGGHLYCLPCVWASDNDVDGLPQMLMEAMACELPVISTRLVGIPDLVVHEKTGLLVEPNNAKDLADAMERLIREPQLRSQLAREGRKMVLTTFDLDSCIDSLIEEFRKRL